MQSIKEHNLKANHNSIAGGLAPELSVCNLSKNTIWKQITTVQYTTLYNHSLYAIYQRTQSESKSQLSGWILRGNWVCMQSIKEHNLKANHNKTNKGTGKQSSVCNLSKNTIWKQITTRVYIDLTRLICMQSIKEHNLKANHNDTEEAQSRIESVCNLSKNTIWKQITTTRTPLLS